MRYKIQLLWNVPENHLKLDTERGQNYARTRHVSHADRANEKEAFIPQRMVPGRMIRIADIVGERLQQINTYSTFIVTILNWSLNHLPP